MTDLCAKDGSTVTDELRGLSSSAFTDLCREANENQLPELMEELKELSPGEFQAICEESERLHLQRVRGRNEAEAASAQSEVFRAPDAPWIAQE